ncbi:CHAT domain-containing protein [Amycolatopsis pretoriensis]|uniref:CHAT domain-containing protein n=1 Tax=Amycolatopsis pretoriensis TaxID=218821 RepID=A0A1H5RDY2_9PSEU|nr:CHAT domain-containing protein [Amycolatopsis pretoriensis]SEF35838.1 CHAT domain-containing protein [Amycolatopsis pretoriensis]
MPPDDERNPGRDAALRDLVGLVTRFGETADPEVLTSADADRCLSALAAAADVEVDLQVRHALGTLHWLRHSVTGEDDDLRLSVALLGSFADSAPALVPVAMWPLLAGGTTTAGTAANRLVRRFLESGDRAVLLPALDLFRTAAGDQRSASLSNLCAALQLAAEHLPDPGLLPEAVSAGRAAVAAGEGSRTAHIHLSQALVALGLHRGDANTTAEGVAVARAALAGSADRAGANQVLAAALQAEHSLSGGLEKLREAADLTGEAAKLVPLGTPEAIRVHANHTAALNALFDGDGSTATLAEAVSAGRAVAEDLGPGRPEARVVLGNLAMSLLSLHERTHETALLDEAEKHTENAIAAAAHQPADAAALRANLSLIHRTRFSRTRSPDALDLAITTGRAALGGMDERDPRRTAAAANLSHALHARFRQSGDLASLREAADRAREVVARTPKPAPSRPGRLADLCAVLRSLFERTRAPEVAVEAARAAREAVLDVSEQAPEFPTVLNTTALLLRTVSAAAGDDEMLAEADRLSRAAVQATPPGSPDLPARLSNKMIISRSRWQRTGDPRHLRDAVEQGRAAIGLIDDGHPDLPSVRANLGLALSTLHDVDGTTSLRAEALRCYTDAARSPRAVPLLRIWAARSAAALAVAEEDLETATAHLEDAVALLPRLAGRALGRDDREHLLGRINGFAAQLGRTFCLTGAPDRAVELLEQVRGLLQAETMQERGADFADLRRLAPDVADRVDEVLGEFAADEPADDDPLATPDAAQRRERLDRRWRDLVVEARGRPGLKNFLRPPELSELRSAARGGPVVYVYAHNDGCGALVVRADAPVRIVELDENLRSDEVFARANELRAAIAASTDKAYVTRVSAERQVSGILEWLWDAFAGPILAELGEPERVWWCPIGVMGYFPIHAAGHHREGAGRTVLDRVVSSYTPTLRALGYAAERAEGDGTAVLVSVPSPPDAARLRGVAAEVAALSALLPEARLLTGEAAVADAVVTAMRRAAISHLACHGVSDWAAPGFSRLLLADHDTSPLTLRGLAGLDFAGAALCYLSACSTSDAAPQLADQALHITSAVQLIGYRHVIGTLWPVNDRSARMIATGFYSRLRGEKGVPDTAVSATALRAAVAETRDVMPGVPSHWAGHVHVGC